MTDTMTGNGGNKKGNREIKVDGFTDNEIIAQLNDEVENVNMNYLDNNDNDDNDDNDDNNYYDDDNNNGDDERREYVRNNYKEEEGEEEGDDGEEVEEGEDEEEVEEEGEENFPKELLKCKLKFSSSSASLSSSSRRFDLTSAYRSLLSDQDSMRRSQGTFLKNQGPKKEVFRSSKSCPRNGEEERGMRVKGSEHVKGREIERKGEREREREKGSGSGSGREGIRYDGRSNFERRRSEEGDNRSENMRHKDDERRSGEGGGRDRGSDRGKGRGMIRDYEAIENENMNDIFDDGYQDGDDSVKRQVEVTAEPTMKRGRGRERGKGKGSERKSHVQYVRPASASASKDFKSRNTASFSTSNRPPVQNIPPYTGNYYPLRSSTSTSNRLLPARQIDMKSMTLNDRNAFSLPYPCIIPDSQPYYQNALTNAVEKVVTDFFR